MIAALVAAAIQSAPAVVLQTTRSAPSACVRLDMTVDGYGINGTATLLVDREHARYAEHFNLGPQSFDQGFDGTRAWQADVTGTTALQGNRLDRDTVRAWGDLFAFQRPAGAPGHVEVDPATHRVKRFSMWNGSFNEVAMFGGYHRLPDGTIVPRSIALTDDNGTWKARVTRVETAPANACTAFAPPPRPHDASIAGGETSVPFLVATEIIIPVHIGNGPVMHFILDTGGQNVLASDSLKRLHLHAIGRGTVSGAGAGVIPTSFVTVPSLRIGAAELRNQPFLVINSSILNGIDGIVGFEVLSRFAARIDYHANTLTLATSVPQSWIAGVPPTPFVFRSRAPQIEGSIDAYGGALLIDTGNSGVLDVNAPFAQAHDLWTYYRARKPHNGSITGVGGSVASSKIVVKSLRLGSGATVPNVHGELTRATAGIEANASFAANLGEGIFRNFTFILDYAHQQLFFAPGGIHDMSGVLFTKRGNHIVVQDVRTRSARAAGIRAGMVLTRLNGHTVDGRDLAAVRARLDDQEPGTHVDMTFAGGTHAKLLLLNYL